MRTPLPPQLPDHLPAYAPGRIHLVPVDEWPIDVEMERLGVRSSMPRYGLDVLSQPIPIDPERVRWLTERAATRPLESRHVHLTNWLGKVYVVDGHHALAAHLITGAEQLPVRLVQPVAPSRSSVRRTADAAEPVA